VDFNGRNTATLWYFLGAEIKNLFAGELAERGSTCGTDEEQFEKAMQRLERAFMPREPCSVGYKQIFYDTKQLLGERVYVYYLRVCNAARKAFPNEAKSKDEMIKHQFASKLLDRDTAIAFIASYDNFTIEEMLDRLEELELDQMRQNETPTAKSSNFQPRTQR
jgi:hypothetical protein